RDAAQHARGTIRGRRQEASGLSLDASVAVGGHIEAVFASTLLSPSRITRAGAHPVATLPTRADNHSPSSSCGGSPLRSPPSADTATAIDGPIDRSTHHAALVTTCSDDAEGLGPTALILFVRLDVGAHEQG